VKDSQISTLATRIAEQMKQPTSAVGAAPAAPVASTPGKGSTSSFLWGAATVAGLFLAAPLFRPVVRQAVKGGLRLGQYAKQVASSAKEELEDITAEAKADMFRDAFNGKNNIT